MPRVVGIDHLVLSGGDLARSKDFYGRVLGFLGFELRYDHADMVGGSNRKTLFWIAQADAQGQAEAPQGRHQLPSLFAWSHFRTENRLPLFLKMLHAFELSGRKDVDALGAFS